GSSADHRSIAEPPAFGSEAPRRLFDHCTEREQRLFSEWPTDQLQAKRQTLGIKPAWDGNARQAREVHRHREYVIEVHFDRIGPTLFADGKRGRGCGRREFRVDAGVTALLEIALGDDPH